MAGKGTNGLLDGLAMPDIVAVKQKCPESPTKRKFYSMKDAEEAATFSSQQYRKTVVPYACAACGLFHVTGKVRGGDVIVHSRDDGIVMTRSMERRDSRQPSESLPERKDMSEIVAMEKPIVPVNWAAREKIAREWLAESGKTKVQIGEIEELLSCGRTPARHVMTALGWIGKRGPYGGWYSPDYVPPTADAKDQPVSAGFEVFKKSAGKHKSKQAKRVNIQANALRGFLVGKDVVGTPEIMESLGLSEYKARELIRAEGWPYVGGTDRRWHRPKDDTVSEAVTVDVTSQDVTPAPTQWLVAAQDAAAERDMVVARPIDLPTRWAREQAVAAAAEAELWRDMELNDKLYGMSLQQVCDTMEAFGLEFRIQIRV